MIGRIASEEQEEEEESEDFTSQSARPELSRPPHSPRDEAHENKINILVGWPGCNIFFFFFVQSIHEASDGLAASRHEGDTQSASRLRTGPTYHAWSELLLCILPKLHQEESRMFWRACKGVEQQRPYCTSGEGHFEGYVSLKERTLVSQWFSSPTHCQLSYNRHLHLGEKAHFSLIPTHIQFFQ